MTLTVLNPSINIEAQFVTIDVTGAPVKNFPVQLQKNWKRVCKLGTGKANILGINNIFLHFTPLQFASGAPTSDVANLCGATPLCFPLEQLQVLDRYVWKFCKGLPSVVYISMDYQADADHTEMFLFTNDDIIMEQNIRV